MNKKNLLNALRSVDEDGAVQLGTAYHGIPDSEHERLLQRIEDALQAGQITEEIPQDEPIPTIQVNRLAWLSYAATAAACVLVFGGTFAGLFWMHAHAPVRPEDVSTSVSEPVLAAPAYAVGESYAAENLTSRGELQITVLSADVSEETGLYEVTLDLWSEGARARDGSDLFLADNFLVAVGERGGIWDTVSPCAIRGTDAEDYPYTIWMAQHMGRTVTLSYALDGKPPVALVTSRNTSIPYTKLTED